MSALAQKPYIQKPPLELLLVQHAQSSLHGMKSRLQPLAARIIATGTEAEQARLQNTLRTRRKYVARREHLSLYRYIHTYTHTHTHTHTHTYIRGSRYVARREQKLAEKTVFNRRVAKDTGRIKGEVSLLQVRFAYARTNARAHTRMHAHARARANRNTHTHTHTQTHTGAGAPMERSDRGCETRVSGKQAAAGGI